MSKAKETKLRYTGADGAISRDVGAVTSFGDTLEYGLVYTLPSELAARLLASTACWEPVKGEEAHDA